MSGGDLVAVIVAIVSVASVTVLVVALWTVLQVLRRVETSVAELRDETLPAVRQLRGVVDTTEAELERVDALLDSAESVAGSVVSAAGAVDSVSRVARLLVVGPVVRLVAAGRAGRRVVKRLRGAEVRPALRRVA